MYHGDAVSIGYKVALAVMCHCGAGCWRCMFRLLQSIAGSSAVVACQAGALLAFHHNANVSGDKIQGAKTCNGVQNFHSYCVDARHCEYR